MSHHVVAVITGCHIFCWGLILLLNRASLKAHYWIRPPEWERLNRYSGQTSSWCQTHPMIFFLFYLMKFKCSFNKTFSFCCASHPSSFYPLLYEANPLLPMSNQPWSVRLHNLLLVHHNFRWCPSEYLFSNSCRVFLSSTSPRFRWIKQFK